MQTVIIICDDPRMKFVKDAIQPLLTTKISVATNFSEGLQMIFEKQPLVVFIADNICGIKRETVIHHVKSLLQSSSPRFITLDHIAVGHGLTGDFCEGINLDVPVEELVEVLRTHLEKVPSILWVEHGPRPTTLADPDVVSFAHVPASSHSLLTSQTSLVDAQQEKAPVLPNTTIPINPKIFRHDSKVAPITAASARQQSGIPRGTRSPLRWFVCIVTLFVFSFVDLQPEDYAVPFTSSPLVSASTVLARSPPHKELQLWQLPSFISKDGLDQSYSTVWPGWERYCSSQREYLIFRDGGFIRIIQVIAVNNGAITPSFVSAALRELCGTDTTVIGEKSTRDGYIIMQAKVSSKAEITYYKKKSTDETHGIVIELF